VTVWTLIGERMVESRFVRAENRKRRQWWAETGAGFAEAALLQACGGEGLAVLPWARRASASRASCARSSTDVWTRCIVQVRWQCSPYHTDSALWPVIQCLARLAGLAVEDDRTRPSQAGDHRWRSTRHLVVATLLGLKRRPAVGRWR